MSSIRTPPDWWRQCGLQVAEIAKFLGVPRRTAADWISKAIQLGHCAPHRRGVFRFYSAHDAMALALLAKLHAIDWPIDADIVERAFDFATEHYATPQPATHGEVWPVVDVDGVAVHVEAWLLYSAVKHRFDPTRSDVDGYCAGHIV